MDRLKGSRISETTHSLSLQVRHAVRRLTLSMVLSIALGASVPFAAGAMPISVDAAEDTLHAPSFHARPRVVWRDASVRRPGGPIPAISVTSPGRDRPEQRRRPAHHHIRKTPSVPDSPTDVADH